MDKAVPWLAFHSSHNDLESCLIISFPASRGSFPLLARKLYPLCLSKFLSHVTGSKVIGSDNVSAKLDLWISSPMLDSFDRKCRFSQGPFCFQGNIWRNAAESELEMLTILEVQNRNLHASTHEQHRTWQLRRSFSF